jgi:hypothetical protein
MINQSDALIVQNGIVGNSARRNRKPTKTGGPAGA